MELRSIIDNSIGILTELAVMKENEYIVYDDERLEGGRFTPEQYKEAEMNGIMDALEQLSSEETAQLLVWLSTPLSLITVDNT
jgi:hypothetical protein